MISTLFCTAQTVPNVQWTNHYSTQSSVLGLPTVPAAIDANKNTYVAGYAVKAGSGLDYVLIKYDSVGVQKWVQSYDGGFNNTDIAVAMGLDNAGNIYITGKSMSSTSNFDIVTVKYNASGVLLWSVRYNGTGNNIDEPVAIHVSNTGEIYIVGTTTNVSANTDITTLKYNSSGVLQWSKHINGTANTADVAKNIYVQGNRVYVVGNVVDNVGSLNGIITRYHVNTGNVQWQKTYNGSFNGEDELLSVMADNNDVWVCGSTQTSLHNIDYVTLKLNANTGNIAWTQMHDGYGLQDKASSLVINSAGEVFVTGVAQDSTFCQYHTLKYNNSGVLQWQKTQSLDELLDMVSNGSNLSLVDKEHIIKTDLNCNEISRAKLSGGSTLNIASITLLNSTTLAILGRTNTNSIQSKVGSSTLNLSFINGMTGVEDLFFHKYDFNLTPIPFGRLYGQSSKAIYPKECSVDNFGRLVICGYSFYGGVSEAFLLPINTSTLTIDWTKIISSSMGTCIYNDLFITPNNSIIVVGSNNNYSFTTTGPSGFFKQVNNGNEDVFIQAYTQSLPSTSTLYWSTCIGGSGRDVAIGVFMDQQNKLYVVGSTESSPFHSIVNGGSGVYYQSIYGGGRYDGWVGRFDLTSSSLSINTTASIHQNNIKLYPNPSTSVLNVEVKDLHKYAIKGYIYNTIGQMVKEILLESELTQFSIENFAPGMYFLQIPELNTNLKIIKL